MKWFKARRIKRRERAGSIYRERGRESVVIWIWRGVALGSAAGPLNV